MPIGEHLTQARRLRSMTQAQLAGALGVPQKTISAWEKDEALPDAGQLMALGRALNLSLDALTGLAPLPRDWTLRTRVFDEERMYAQVKARASALGLSCTLRVLPLVRQWHAGQYRKGEGNVPYISHPLTMACHALSMGLREDGLMCAILLHDVPEDCGVPVEELPVPPRVQRTIARLTYRRQGDESAGEARRRYYAEIRRDPGAMLVKLLDRCCNVSGMAAGFTRERMAGYVQETEEHVLPLFALLAAQAPEYADALWLLRYQLLSLLEAYKRLL